MCFLFQIIESLVKNGYSWSLKACGGCSRTRDQGKFQRPLFLSKFYLKKISKDPSFRGTAPNGGVLALVA